MTDYSSGQAARILVVSGEEAAKDEVAEALRALGGDHRLYWVSQPDLASARCQELLPHIVLVDDALGGAAVYLDHRDVLFRTHSEI